MSVHAGGPIDFTDGSNFQRATITEPACTPRSDIVVSVTRTDVADADDAGWVYVANVVTRQVGSFDVNVCAFVMGAEPINDEGPNEIVALTYILD